MPLESKRRTTIAAILACAGLLLVGWSGLLVPSLIRSIEPAFGQTDAGIGVYFFVNAVAYVGGSMVGGLLTERIGRRVVLPLAVSLIALGLAGLATVPTWELFLAATIPLGLGGGGIDGGMNGLVLDLYPEGRGRALNLAPPLLQRRGARLTARGRAIGRRPAWPGRPSSSAPPSERSRSRC